MNKQITISLNQSNEEVYRKSKEDQVRYFNFREINHHSHGKLTYVYPGGTIAGGHIGIVPKNIAKSVGTNPEVIDYRLDNGKVIMDLLVKSPDKKGNTLAGCLWAIVFVVVFGLIISMCIGSSDEGKTADELLIEKHFSAWDGSHIELVKKVKSNLKDPDSYEHINTTYRIEGDTIWVFMNYRAKNSFGGYTTGGITGITDKQTGKVIDWMEQE